MHAELLDARTRLRWTLEGLATGDAFGERVFQAGLEYHQSLDVWSPEQRPLPMGHWEYTDDTQMALSIAEVLCTYQTINQDALAHSFAQRFERHRGYGPAMYQLLPQLRIGAAWQTAAAALFGGRGSYGNGAAMRVAPVGAYFADNIDLVVDQAQRSAVVTHTHPEAVAGAIAIAVATAYAWRLRNTLTYETLLSLVTNHVPESEVKRRIKQVRLFPADVNKWDVIKAVGNGSGIMAQDTVPFTLWCAARSLHQYEQAIWDTASGLGDIDTNCAIVGGIVVAVTGIDGIPIQWRQRRESLPAWAFPEQPIT